MREKELYQQKVEARLEELKAEISRLRAQASGASADAQLEINKQIDALEDQLAEGESKLAALAAAGEDSWESIKEDIDTAWQSLQSALRDAVSR